MAIRKIVSRSIGVDVIAAEDLADNSVTAAEIQDGVIGLSKLSATGTKDATTFLRGDNSFQVVTTPTLSSLGIDNHDDIVVDANGVATFDGVVLPSFASDSAANTGNVNTAGSIYYNTTNKVVKSYNGTYWNNVGTPSGDQAPATFDILGDGSCISFHDFNNTSNDTGGIYNGTRVGGGYLTTPTPKFGSHILDVYGNGVYYDIAGLPRFYAVSIWYYCDTDPTDAAARYIFDFRHDNPSNGRSYFYLNPSDAVSLGDDTTAVNKTGDVYIDGVLLTSSFTFSQNTWYHVVCSVDNDTESSDHQRWDAGLRIGNRSDGTAQGQTGYFDRCRIFNRPLNSGDVQVLYQEGA